MLCVGVPGLKQPVGERESGLWACGPASSPEVELIILPAVNPHHIQPTDFEHASGLIGQAVAAAGAMLDSAIAAEPVAA
jgi:hypothetical protein